MPGCFMWGERTSVLIEQEAGLVQSQSGYFGLEEISYCCQNLIFELPSLQPIVQSNYHIQTPQYLCITEVIRQETMRLGCYDKEAVLYDFTIQAKSCDMFLTDICEVFPVFLF